LILSSTRWLKLSGQWCNSQAAWQRASKTDTSRWKRRKSWLWTGGIPWFYCTHQYAHTCDTSLCFTYSKASAQHCIFQALGVRITVRHLLGADAFKERNEYCREMRYEEDGYDSNNDDLQDFDEIISRVRTSFLDWLG
jgi:hypothetical protein